MVRAAPALGHDVVHGEVAEGEHHLAPAAQPLLLAEEYVLALAVVLVGVSVGAPPPRLAKGAEAAFEYLLAVLVVVGQPAQSPGLGVVGAIPVLGT